MPSIPLVDPRALDCTRVLRTPDEIYSVCRQSGRFRLLDGIVRFDPESNEPFVGFKDIRADDWWASDHIPGRPIFPGALQIEAAAQLCTYDFMHRRKDLEGHFVGFAGLNDTRFRGIIEPGMRMVLAAKVEKVRHTMFTYLTQAFVADKLVFETEIIGMVL